MLTIIWFISIVLALSHDHVWAHQFHDALPDADHEHFHFHGLRSSHASSVGGNKTTSVHRDLQISQNESRCGSKDPPKSWIKESARIMNKWRSNQRQGLNQVSTIEVPTYFHVITAGTVGAISRSQLQQQLQVLNDSYRPYGFSFTLKNITRTDNSVWYSSDAFSVDDEEMKSALRIGGVSTLNVYFKNCNYLGYATFPEDYNDDPKLDGVIVQRNSLPGSSSLRYNEGKTLVHETGHWLGLYHTFQAGTSVFQYLPVFSRLWNGCLTDGDLVDDTPPQRTATFGCPTGKDTCFFQSGVDPIDNYMDYSDDSCYSQFTAGQTERMWAMWNEYRASP